MILPSNSVNTNRSIVWCIDNNMNSINSFFKMKIFPHQCVVTKNMFFIFDVNSAVMIKDIYPNDKDLIIPIKLMFSDGSPGALKIPLMSGTIAFKEIQKYSDENYDKKIKNILFNKNANYSHNLSFIINQNILSILSVVNFEGINVIKKISKGTYIIYTVNYDLYTYLRKIQQINKKKNFFFVLYFV